MCFTLRLSIYIWDEVLLTSEHLERNLKEVLKPFDATDKGLSFSPTFLLYALQDSRSRGWREQIHVTI